MCCLRITSTSMQPNWLMIQIIHRTCACALNITVLVIVVFSHAVVARHHYTLCWISCKGHELGKRRVRMCCLKMCPSCLCPNLAYDPQNSLYTYLTLFKPASYRSYYQENSASRMSPAFSVLPLSPRCCNIWKYATLENKKMVSLNSLHIIKSHTLCVKIIIKLFLKFDFTPPL